MIKYDIKYEGLYEELVKDDYSHSVFNTIVKHCNDMRIEITEEEFSVIFEIEKLGKDGIWLITNMSKNKKSLYESLISYIKF